MSSLREYAYSNILKFLPTKNENSEIKISDFFYFCWKLRLWVFVRTTSTRWFLRVPTIYGFWAKIRKMMYIKVGFDWGQNYIGMFSWWLYRADWIKKTPRNRWMFRVGDIFFKEYKKSHLVILNRKGYFPVNFIERAWSFSMKQVYVFYIQ